MTHHLAHVHWTQRSLTLLESRTQPLALTIRAMLGFRAQQKSAHGLERSLFCESEAEEVQNIRRISNGKKKIL